MPLFIQVLTLTFFSFKYIYCETVYLLLMNIYLIPMYIYQNNSHLNKSVGNYACIVHLVGFKKNEKSLWTEIHVYYIALLL